MSPGATNPAIVGKIVYLRQHYRFGPEKISMYRKRYQKPLPGHRVQIDEKFIEPVAGTRKKHYQFTGIGDCTGIPGAPGVPMEHPEDAKEFDRMLDAVVIDDTRATVSRRACPGRPIETR